MHRVVFLAMLLPLRAWGFVSSAPGLAGGRRQLVVPAAEGGPFGFFKHVMKEVDDMVVRGGNAFNSCQSNHPFAAGRRHDEETRQRRRTTASVVSKRPLHQRSSQAFYGKRKSNFYGKNDPGKRQGPDDNAEYSGPKGGSYFKLDREGRPVTRRGTPLYDVDSA